MKHTEGQAWYAVTLFALVLMMNFVDRGLIALLVEPMKQDLGLSDTQISLVMGLAFVLFQALIALPLARLIDTRSRRLILSLCIASWSLMTAVCGLAQTYWQLFAARVGVGLGEAGNGPATYSLLSDYFPPERLPRAIAVLQLGYASGQGLTLLVGGLLFAWISGLSLPTLPGLGPLKAWQLTFILAGLPGLVLALLVLTIREPQRRGLLLPGHDTSRTGKACDHTGTDNLGEREQSPHKLSLKELLHFLHERRHCYYPLFAAMGLKTILTFGYAGWIPAFYMRRFGWTTAEVGLVQGGIMLLIVPFGLFAGSFLTEYWQRRGRDSACLDVVILGSWLAIPCSILYPLMPTAWSAVLLVGLFYFFSMMVPAPQNTALQIITPNQLRAQVMAVFLFIYNIIGFGLGPTVIALFTDVVFQDPNRLGHAMALAAALIGPAAGVLFLLARQPYRHRHADAQRWQSTPEDNHEPLPTP